MDRRRKETHALVVTPADAANCRLTESAARLQHVSTVIGPIKSQGDVVWDKVLEARDFTNWPRKSRHLIDGAIKAMNRTKLRINLRVACSIGAQVSVRF